MRSWQSLKEFPGAHTECLGQFDNVEERDIPLAALNSSDVVPVQAGPLCELFLGVAALLAEGANRLAER